jgi:hypothetical protein
MSNLSTIDSKITKWFIAYLFINSKKYSNISKKTWQKTKREKGEEKKKEKLEKNTALFLESNANNLDLLELKNKVLALKGYLKRKPISLLRSTVL